ALAQPIGTSAVRKPGDVAPPRFVMRTPTVADPFHWLLGFETDDEVRWRGVALDGTSTAVAQRGDVDVEKHLSDPVVRRAMASPEAAAWRYFARVPTAWT